MNTTTQRTFDSVELMQIKEVKKFMSTAFNVGSWNYMREQAKTIWSNKIISAVDGLYKWAIKYDKPSKITTCLGVKFR